MKIFVITDLMIYPPRGGAPVRIFGLLSHMCRRHEIVLFVPTRHASDAEGKALLESMGIKVETIAKPQKRRLPKAIWARLRATFSPIPAYWVLTNDDDIAQALASAVERHKPDVIQIEYLGNCRYINSLSTATPLVLDEYDVVGDREVDMARAMGRSIKAKFYAREASKALPLERKMMSRMDLTIACSEIDRVRFEKLCPEATVVTVANGVELEHYKVAPPVDGMSLVYTGSLDNLPNIEAACELANELFPRILSEVPDATAKIVGRRPAPSVRALAGNGLEVVADVPDIRPYIAEASVVVVPLRTGGGTRIKILEAMAMGKAIVSTNKGAEGLDLRDGHDIILRDDHNGFTAAVVDLLKSPEERIRLGANARVTAESNYGFEALSVKWEKELLEMLKRKAEVTTR